MSYKIGANPCPKCRENGSDVKGDNFHFYGEGRGGFCFKCGYTELSDDEKSRRSEENFQWTKEMEEEVTTQEKLTEEQITQIKGYTGERANNLRGISDKTYRAYGVRHKYNEETGEPVEQYYPITEGYAASGYKIRILPKSFSRVGKVGKQSDLFGQWKWKTASGKFVVLTAGECFTGETEVLTEDGFTKFKDLEKGKKVLQINDDMSSSFVVPLAYVEKEYNGELVHCKSQKYEVLCTPHHNLYLEGRKENCSRMQHAEDHIPTSQFFKLSTKHNGCGTGLTKDQIALTLAVCADSKNDVRASGKIYAHFGLLKQRKIDRLRGILDRLGQEYTSYTSTRADGKTYTTFNLTLPDYIKGKKIPTSWISSATMEEKDFILEELRWWDGNDVKNRSYTELSTKHYSEASTVQALCSTSGRYSTIRYRKNSFGEWYVVSIHNKEIRGGTQQLRKSSSSFSGRVFCVTVPSGKLFIRHNGKTMVIGNCDAMAAYQMLEEYRLGKNSDFEPIPVVSSIIGETGSYGQCALHYEWFDRFERIIVIYDQDKAGQDALKDLVKVLPKGKMFTVDLPMKDCNEMLSAGKQKAFIDCFWKAKPYTPDGIIGSGSLSDKMRIELSTPKIPLPPFMHKLQKMMAGGIPLGRIVNLGSASGTGKSTITDELLYYWVFNSPHKIGVVSLESDAGQYGIKILSRHCGTKIELFETPEDALQFMDQEWVKEKERELLFLPNGQNRWHIVEDRDGGVESMKKQIMKLIVECECMVVILDPLQDILDGLSNEEQAVFLRWMKGVIKSHGVTFITINHVRKSGNGQKANSAGAELYEEDMSGSSTIFKSGACNLLFSRNKEAEDAVERNTTKLKMTKCRWSGITGYAGEYYYDLKSHTLWDKEEYFSAHTVEF